MAVFAVLALIGPLLLLATTVVGLWSYGPLGWLASVLLVAAVAGSCRWSTRAALRWWRSTKVPARPQVRPADARRRAVGHVGSVPSPSSSEESACAQSRSPSSADRRS